MNRNGLTLVELITVIAIICILVAMGTLNFNSMSRKYAIEGQTRGLYADLMETRLMSMYKKKSHYVTLTAGAYVIYSSGSRSAPAGVVLRKNLRYPITWNGAVGSLIEFDTHGLTNDQRSLCVSQNEAAPAVDSVVIAMARQNLGKRKGGQDCASANIDIK